jgi:hypothetical protein
MARAKFETEPAINNVSCISCGASVPDTQGSVHQYLISSPGCWVIYEEVLAREFADYRYGRKHRLTADAYAIQHPGKPSPRTIQSVVVHLAGLYLVLERGLPIEKSSFIMQRLTAHKSSFHWLTPPEDPGPITIFDVWQADNPETHLRLVQDWAASAWSAWEAHHRQIIDWIGMVNSS